jgi:sirohydrochlorin ferrochelatase
MLFITPVTVLSLLITLAAVNGFFQTSRTNMKYLSRDTLTISGLSAVSSTSNPQSEKVAVILVDHGSRKAEANDMLLEVARKYKTLYNIEIVEAAHMELSEPSISTAFKKCVEQGAERIICHPFFLSKGRHVQEDIPNMMREAAAEHSTIREVEYSITEPLGVQEKILELIHQSIASVSDSVAP